MHLRTIKAGDGPLLKTLTLRSVEEAPYAFGGFETIGVERNRPDAEWDALAAECGGDVEAWRDRCVGCFFFDGETPCAKALAFLSGKERGLAHMTGVWVDPEYRRRGLGRQMVQAACAWAASKGAKRLLLWVDDTNPDGATFYAALGFRPTGESRRVSRTSTDRESAFVLALQIPET